MIRRAAAAVLAFMVVSVGAVAAAAIPDSGGVIHACYKLNAPERNSLRVLDTEAGQTCPAWWAPLDWNQTGPQGPPGTPGSGLSNVHVDTYRFTIEPLSVTPNPQNFRTPEIPGQFVLSVGWEFAYGPNGENPQVRELIVQKPDATSPTGYPRDWSFSFYGGLTPQDVVIFVTRSNVPS